MTEIEKQRSGICYDPTDAEICKMRKKGSILINKLNSCKNTKKQFLILKKLFAEIGNNVRINTPFRVDFGCHTYIGNDTVININCTFLDASDIKIGNRVLIGPDTKIYTAFHPNSPAKRFISSEKGNYFLTQSKAVTIGDNAWIGGNVTILPGVSIGKNTVIGAGSVVTKDIPDNVIAVGNPCKVIKRNI